METATVKYYPINEDLARRAKEMNSFRDYIPGTATAQYRSQVDKAVEIAEKQKAKTDPMYHEKIDGLLDAYARKLADNLNDSYRIGAMCPSVMISGGSNFPVKKKEKQNAASDRNMAEYQEIQKILDKIRGIGQGGISSDDPLALVKLQKKLAQLEATQRTMKAVNSYYRKHKTLDGCTDISEDQIRKLKAEMAYSWHLEDKPFASFALSNNNANIKRTRERIAELEKRQTEAAPEGWTFDGGTVEINTSLNRIQIFYDEKPSFDLRSELKSRGFRWAPSQNAWQRQLTDNAISAAQKITKGE